MYVSIRGLAKELNFPPWDYEQNVEEPQTELELIRSKCYNK